MSGAIVMFSKASNFREHLHLPLHQTLDCFFREASFFDINLALTSRDLGATRAVKLGHSRRQLLESPPVTLNCVRDLLGVFVL